MLFFVNKTQSILEPPRGGKRAVVVILLLWIIGSIIMYLNSQYLQIISFQNKCRNNKQQ